MFCFWNINKQKEVAIFGGFIDDRPNGNISYSMHSFHFYGNNVLFPMECIFGKDFQLTSIGRVGFEKHSKYWLNDKLAASKFDFVRCHMSSDFISIVWIFVASFALLRTLFYFSSLFSRSKWCFISSLLHYIQVFFAKNDSFANSQMQSPTAKNSNIGKPMALTVMFNRQCVWVGMFDIFWFH